MKKKEGSEEDDRQKESRQEKDKGGKQEKGETCRSNGQPRRNDDGSHISVARSQRETRAEPSGCVAVPHGLPAVTGTRRNGRQRKLPPSPEAQRTGLVIRPKNGDLGRSARLPLVLILVPRPGRHSPGKHGETAVFTRRLG